MSTGNRVDQELGIGSERGGDVVLVARRAGGSSGDALTGMLCERPTGLDGRVWCREGTCR